MRDTVRLGRIGGVPVGANWSLVVVAGLLAYVLAKNRLPFDAPGYASSDYAVVGVLTAVGLLVTVLAHELGHAMVARRAKLQVDGITLSWIGGITRIEGEASSPAVEAAIAAIGPLVSLALGGALFGLRELLTHAGGSRLAVAAVGWLAVINIVLAVFNLLPAAPLDGGRILHAAAWRVLHDRWRAGRLASSAGIGLGAVVIGAGFLEASVARGSGNVFDALITGMLGWWLITAARSERQTADVHRALHGCHCADVMRPVRAGPGWVSVDTFLAGCQGEYQAPGPVWLLEGWGDEGYVGVVATEVMQAVPVPRRAVVRPIDVAVPITGATSAKPGDDVLQALTASTGARVILIVEEGHTVGAIVPADVDSIVHGGPRLAPSAAAASATTGL